MWFASLIFLYLSFVINLKLMKKIKILSLFVCLIALLAACEDEDITPSYGARTVLVYIAGIIASVSLTLIQRMCRK